ncbi:MAG: hypothetical protein E5V58_06435 [Mesorhizobium sp.]|nr:MAG: hypothetical protein EOS32_17910 [Mesorhizobium sp.]TIW74387.1 MAG: hypothetical protein E5V58_06435 [Mesorhizobium sp.]
MGLRGKTSRCTAFCPTPLCPAGHLPRKGGDWISSSLSPIADAAGRAPLARLPISPLAGEMAGRPEGGAQAPCHHEETKTVPLRHHAP